MKEKRYSISQIQKIIDVSPNDLQKLIRKNSARLRVQTRALPDGSKEIFLDEESFKKLVFIKQLETGIKLSIDEVCELIREKKLGDDQESLSGKTDEISTFDSSLQAVENEVYQLRTQLTRMMVRYDHCLKELNLSRSKAIALEGEMNKLKNREAALMGQLRKFSADFYEEDLCRNELN